MATIFFDIDGTLIDCLNGLIEPTEKSRYAFEQLIKNGHCPIIATGRMKSMIPHAIVSLPTKGYLLCNGACLQLEDGNSFMDPISEEVLARFEKRCEELDALYYLETQQECFTNGLNSKRHEQYIFGWEDHTEYLPIECRNGKPVLMMMLLVNDEESAQALKDEFKDELLLRGQMEFELYYDVNRIHTSKGQAITDFIRYQHLKKEDCYAFGDSYNDVEMLQAVGHGYAMGNACEPLKQCCEEVVDTVLNDGIYYQLVKLGLIDPMK